MGAKWRSGDNAPSERFIKETFLPEYSAMEEILRTHLTEVAERVVAEVLNADKSEPAVVDEPRQLEAFAPPAPLSTTK